MAITYLLVVLGELFDPLEEFGEELRLDNSLYDLRQNKSIKQNKIYKTHPRR